ncbi:hypothetical protein FA15DRAFT_707975 [Coprinopsis marcescibilis]|uniref:Uncharacterized protein n=1 Tax=Coprinopsis marcescibilis TaxID=230819 RepID=A0A5C3KKU1_COPMA|nr:hypothetical protein FA15DRAFT_707975 [Coprinopsis marcescibilis]
MLSWLCGCCGSRRTSKPEPFDANSHVIPDENSLLIPPNLESTSYTDGRTFLENQKMQERLATIVRSKEGKMVNLSSHIPFNLHNQPLLPSGSDRTISRSTSGSLDTLALTRAHWSTDDLASHAHHHHHHNHNQYPHGRSSLHQHHSRHSADSRSRSSSSHRRHPHPTDRQPQPTPVLNVRLVGYHVPPVVRGRSRQRPVHRDSQDSGSGWSEVHQGEEGEGVRGRSEGVERDADPTTPKAYAPPGGGFARAGAAGEPAPDATLEPRAVPKKKLEIMLDDADDIVMSWGD